MRVESPETHPSSHSVALRLASASRGSARAVMRIFVRPLKGYDQANLKIPIDVRNPSIVRRVHAQPHSRWTPGSLCLY